MPRRLEIDALHDRINELENLITQLQTLVASANSNASIIAEQKIDNAVAAGKVASQTFVNSRLASEVVGSSEIANIAVQKIQDALTAGNIIGPSHITSTALQNTLGSAYVKPTDTTFLKPSELSETKVRQTLGLSTAGTLISALDTAGVATDSSMTAFTSNVNTQLATLTTNLNSANTNLTNLKTSLASSAFTTTPTLINITALSTPTLTFR